MQLEDQIVLWFHGVNNTKWDMSSYSQIADINNIVELKKHIISTTVIACDEINWTFLGVSFAIYNALLQLILLVTNSMFIIKGDDDA